ncbi:hypothetical protein SGLAM104S_10476 [Streptomyces glaucescens]
MAALPPAARRRRRPRALCGGRAGNRGRGPRGARTGRRAVPRTGRRPGSPVLRRVRRAAGPPRSTASRGESTNRSCAICQRCSYSRRRRRPPAAVRAGRHGVPARSVSSRSAALRVSVVPGDGPLVLGPEAPLRCASAASLRGARSVNRAARDDDDHPDHNQRNDQACGHVVALRVRRSLSGAAPHAGAPERRRPDRGPAPASNPVACTPGGLRENDRHDLFDDGLDRPHPSTVDSPDAARPVAGVLHGGQRPLVPAARGPPHRPGRAGAGDRGRGRGADLDPAATGGCWSRGTAARRGRHVRAIRRTAGPGGRRTDAGVPAPGPAGQGRRRPPGGRAAEDAARALGRDRAGPGHAGRPGGGARRCTRGSATSETAPHNDEPYAEHWFTKNLG